MTINAQLQPLVTSIARLIPDTDNARTHDKRGLVAITQSLVQFGQQKPIVVSPDGTVIAGNGTFLAARALGWKEIAVVEYDGQGDEHGFALADNRTAELSAWDLPALSSKLCALHADGLDVDGLGWTPTELGPLLSTEWAPAPSSDGDVPDTGTPVTVKLTGEQNQVVALAIRKVRDELGQEFTEGRCLELVCADYLAGLGVPADSLRE